MVRAVNRRTALKYIMIGMAGSAAFLPARLLQADQPACQGSPSYNEQFGSPPLLGRIEWEQPVYRTLDDRRAANIARMAAYHEVIPLFGVVHSEPLAGYAHNDRWFKTDGGYVHSAWVVPCHEFFNTPEEVISAGFWGEITVPLAYQHNAPRLDAQGYNPLRWATVYRVVDRQDDACGEAWYRLEDDVYPHQPWWVQARCVRRVRPEELAPISPDVPPEARRIEVDIGAQTLQCFEQGTLVFATRISSGGAYYNADGVVYPFPTPWGEHYVQRKTPSRHMIGGQDIGQPYNLPGVPWCTYFAPTGEAIHGATTHNDFGRPRSHGCINVAPDVAKWIYRWTTPAVAYDEAFYWLPAEDRALATTIVIGGAAGT